jgi:hypothetical protein
MARHCVKWAGGRKRKGGRRKGAVCRHGRVKSGPRKGRCRKVSRRRSSIRSQEAAMWKAYSR